MNYKEIDFNNWKRKPQYDFFKSFDQPFFNVVANVDVTQLQHYTKEKQHSFFYCALYCILKALNEIPEFRCRIDQETVKEYDKVHAGVTILQEDQTFIYCSIDYEESLEDFMKKGQAMVEEQKKSRGFVPHERPNVVYVSALPWVSFTGFQHARKTEEQDSIPRVVLGKYFEERGCLKMPISLEVHHALADGFHVGQFFEKIQKILNTGF